MFDLFQGAAADMVSYVADYRLGVLSNDKAGSAVQEGVGAAAGTFSYVADDRQVVLGNGNASSAVQEGVGHGRPWFEHGPCPGGLRKP